MTFDDILAQIRDVLQRQGRMSYGAIKRRYDLDDAYLDRKSTRLNSSHGYISYAVFCLKKKKTNADSVTPSGGQLQPARRAPCHREPGPSRRPATARPRSGTRRDSPRSARRSRALAQPA